MSADVYGPIAQGAFYEASGGTPDDLLNAVLVVAERLDDLRDALDADDIETALQVRDAIRDALSEPEEETRSELDIARKCAEESGGGLPAADGQRSPAAGLSPEVES